METAVQVVRYDVSWIWFCLLVAIDEIQFANVHICMFRGGPDSTSEHR